jgi:hypothetical protein
VVGAHVRKLKWRESVRVRGVWRAVYHTLRVSVTSLGEARIRAMRGEGEGQNTE